MLMKFLILIVYVSSPYTEAVARFEPASVTDVSLVIRMIKGGNVSSFDMSIQIFDLDRLIEYRKTQLKGSTRDQVSHLCSSFISMIFLSFHTIRRIRCTMMFFNVGGLPPCEFDTRTVVDLGIGSFLAQPPVGNVGLLLSLGDLDRG
uniref:Secreted protein n=1 Tax=Angiostrongylus cantonensis TaxID=6313 RepID=A0A0K0DR08_ANGCA